MKREMNNMNLIDFKAFQEGFDTLKKQDLRIDHAKSICGGYTPHISRRGSTICVWMISTYGTQSLYYEITTKIFEYEYRYEVPVVRNCNLSLDGGSSRIFRAIPFEEGQCFIIQVGYEIYVAKYNNPHILTKLDTVSANIGDIFYDATDKCVICLSRYGDDVTIIHEDMSITEEIFEYDDSVGKFSYAPHLYVSHGEYEGTIIVGFTKSAYRDATTNGKFMPVSGTGPSSIHITDSEVVQVHNSGTQFIVTTSSGTMISSGVSFSSFERVYNIHPIGGAIVTDKENVQKLVFVEDMQQVTINSLDLSTSNRFNILNINDSIPLRSDVCEVFAIGSQVYIFAPEYCFTFSIDDYEVAFADNRAIDYRYGKNLSAVKDNSRNDAQMIHMYGKQTVLEVEIEQQRTTQSSFYIFPKHYIIEMHDRIVLLENGAMHYLPNSGLLSSPPTDSVVGHVKGFGPNYGYERDILYGDNFLRVYNSNGTIKTTIDDLHEWSCWAGFERGAYSTNDHLYYGGNGCLCIIDRSQSRARIIETGIDAAQMALKPADNLGPERLLIFTKTGQLVLWIYDENLTGEFVNVMETSEEVTYSATSHIGYVENSHFVITIFPDDVWSSDYSCRSIDGVHWMPVYKNPAENFIYVDGRYITLTSDIVKLSTGYDVLNSGIYIGDKNVTWAFKDIMENNS